MNGSALSRVVFFVVAILIATAAVGASSPRSSTDAATVTASFTNQPIAAVLLDLGRRFGVTISLESGLDGRITAELHKATLSEALDAVLTPLRLHFAQAGTIFVISSASSRAVAPIASATPSAQTAVISLTSISASQAAGFLARLYPRSHITTDPRANAVVVVDTSENLQVIRSVVAGIDVQSPTAPQSQAVQLHQADPKSTAATLHALFPKARFAVGPNHSLLILASPQELTQIRNALMTIDQSVASPPPTTAPAEAIKITQARPQSVAQAIAHEFPDVRAAVSGSAVVLSGPPDDVEKAKTLIALIDLPAPDARYTQVYRIRYVDAQSVADLIGRSFADVQVTVDKDLNALSVSATATEQQRVSDAITQLDTSSAGQIEQPSNGPPVQVPGSTSNTSTGPGGATMQVITLRSGIPGASGGASTTATDIATAVTQFLQPTAPDLRITVPNESNQLMVSGSPYTLKLAKQLIDQLDVAPPQVVLDTEILEVDENVAKNLGLTFNVAALSTTYSEIPPAPPPTGGTPPPLLGFQPVSRTPLSAQFTLNFLIQNGQARVLADPRITTISGHTASIRAGDTSYILTTTGGGVGTVATQQLQPFQTGVTLDITPVVNAGNSISVTLHPSVSSLAGTAFNLPEIATRDTQTTVTLRDDQTLIIGGLIQETMSRTDTKTPVLGDIPLVGKLFHGVNYGYNRNELIIVVTPHIVTAGAQQPLPGPALPTIPTPKPLPTLPLGMQLPTPEGQLPVLPVASPSPYPSPVPTLSPQPGQVVDGVFTYGAAPQNNIAGPQDPVVIYYASFSPTALRAGTQVQVSAVTSTNVARLAVGYGGFATQLAPTTPGQWQSTFNFIPGSIPMGVDKLQLTMTAYRFDGAASSITIPVTIVR